MTDERAFSLVANERWKSAVRQGYRTVAAFVLAMGLVTPFINRFPLNPWFRPWGEFALATCVCKFLLAVFAVSEILSEWLVRRKEEKDDANGLHRQYENDVAEGK